MFFQKKGENCYGIYKGTFGSFPNTSGAAWAATLCTQDCQNYYYDIMMCLYSLPNNVEYPITLCEPTK